MRISCYWVTSTFIMKRIYYVIQKKLNYFSSNRSNGKLSRTRTTMEASRNNVKTWRVLINPNNWDQKKYQDEWNGPRPEQKRFAQTKGRAKMVVVPRKNDRVNFVISGKIVMRGYVENDGFLVGDTHKDEHSCVKGTFRDRPWDHVNEYLWVKIEEILEEPELIRPSGQRTWAKMPQ